MSNYVIKSFQPEFIEQQVAVGQIVVKDWKYIDQTPAEQLQVTYSQPEFDPETRLYCFKEDKLVGFLTGKTMKDGEEEVVWQHFVLIPQKIIDEFNRIPEANQAMLLDGMDRGEWDYLNEHISTGPQPFFATCNYADRGTNTLIPPILDRFNIVAKKDLFPDQHVPLFRALPPFRLHRIHTRR